MEELGKSNLFDGLSVVHLKLSGLWTGINHYRRTGRISRLLLFYMVIMNLYIFPYVLFQVVCVFMISLDLKTATFIYMTGIIATEIWLKEFMFCYNFRKQCLLFDLIKVDFFPSVPEHKKDGVRQIYKRIAKICNIFSLLAVSGSSLVTVTWMVMPGFSTDGTSSGRKKIASGWYPVAYSKTPWFEIVFSYEVGLIVWHGFLGALLELVLLIPLMGLYGQFLALGYLLSTVDEVAPGNEDLCQDQRNYVLNKELGRILKYYNKLIWFADHFRSTNNAILTIILGSDIGTLILTILYILFGLGDALSTFKLLIFFSFAIIEIGLLCVSSSIVETASSEISYAFYSSGWYTTDKIFAATGKMMMMRAKKPVTLTALKMYPVNMETLINILRFIYSTVAVLYKMK